MFLQEMDLYDMNMCSIRQCVSIAQHIGMLLYELDLYDMNMCPIRQYVCL
jgi:hypothetical protein